MKKRARSHIKDGVRRKKRGGATYNWCCPKCRKTYKENYSTKCSLCHGDLFNIGYKLRPPSKTDDKGWKKVQVIVDREITYREEKARRDIIKSLENEKKS